MGMYVLCLLETYLDLSNLSDDDNFNLPGYNVVRANHLSNTKNLYLLYLFQKLSTFKDS